ncbi:MFS transporter [Aneurinibacillus terranovensis]|uniref:MFS transporter n=1 Tax=Aneurinibacillus terranovensis TaxID=278991 RepID=UPI0004104D1F|nr:MFS transporter [Aneurinibacillus terranovensis]
MVNIFNKKIVTWDFFKVISILFLVEFVRGAFLITFLPLYAADVLGFSVSVVGVAVTAHYFADTAVKSIFGYLLDRFPFRFIVQVGLFLSFLGLLFIPYIHQSWLLIIASTVFGIGISPVWIVCLSKVNEDNRAAQMGFLYTFWLVGLGLGPVVLNFFMDKSYRLSLWILIGLWAIGWLLSLGIRNDKVEKVTMVPVKKQMKMFLERLKTMRTLLPGMVLQTTAAGMLVPILPTFAASHLGLTHSQYSYILIVGGVCAVIGLVPMGRLSDAWGWKWFLVIGFGMLAFGLFFLTFQFALYSIFILAGVLGLSYSAVLPAWNALLSHHIPQGQEGLGWGIFSSVEGIGVIIGPVLGGWIADRFSESLTVQLSALFLGGIALFYCFLPLSLLQRKEI